MTYKEKLMMEHPKRISEEGIGGCYGCPSGYGYCSKDEHWCVIRNASVGHDTCAECWDREMPESDTDPSKGEKENDI